MRQHIQREGAAAPTVVHCRYRTSSCVLSLCESHSRSTAGLPAVLSLELPVDDHRTCTSLARLLFHLSQCWRGEDRHHHCTGCAASTAWEWKRSGHLWLCAQDETESTTHGADWGKTNRSLLDPISYCCFKSQYVTLATLSLHGTSTLYIVVYSFSVPVYFPAPVHHGLFAVIWGHWAHIPGCRDNICQCHCSHGVSYRCLNYTRL